VENRGGRVVLGKLREKSRETNSRSGGDSQDQEFEKVVFEGKDKGFPGQKATEKLLFNTGAGRGPETRFPV